MINRWEEIRAKFYENHFRMMNGLRPEYAQFSTDEEILEMFNPIFSYIGNEEL